MPLILLFGGNHTPYTSFGILNITIVAGYEMKMHMEDGLASSSSRINTNVVAIGMETDVEKALAMVSH